MGSCQSKPQATSTVHANVPPLKVDIPAPESSMSVSAKPASVGSISEYREALPAAGISLVGTTDQGGLGKTLRDLLGPTQLKELEEASRTLFDSIARRHPGLEEVSSLLEQWNNAETKYNTMKPKLDELWTKLKQPDPASGNWETIATAVTGIMDTIDQVANSSLVLKLVWLAVTTVYKMAKNKADSEAAFKDLVDEFQSGMNHIQSLVTTSTSGLTDEAVYSVKTASERYVSSLIELVNTCSEYDNSGSGFEAFGGWKTRFESILADLKAKEDQLSKTEGTATLVAITATHGLAVETHGAVMNQREDLVSVKENLKLIKEELSTRAEDKTNEKMETLAKYLEPVSQIINSDIIYGRDWFVSDVQVWWEEKTNDNCRKYWLCVDAGFGKSKMAWKVFQKFKSHPEYKKKGQSFFFFAFDHNDASYRDPATCVKTLAYNIAEYYKESVPDVTNAIFKGSKKWFGNRDNTKQPSVEELFRDLIAIPLDGKENVEVLLMIDALDEASGDAFVSILSEKDPCPSNVRLFVSSRPSPNLNLKLATKFINNAEKNEKDMNEFASSQLSDYHFLEDYTEGERSKYTNNLVQKSAGNFLVLDLAFQVLKSVPETKESPDAFKIELDKLFSSNLTSGELFDIIWSRLQDNKTHDSSKVTRDLSKARQLLGILLTLERPMTSSGLANLMQVSVTTINQWLQHFSPLLKKVSSKKGRIELRHKTVSAFFRGKEGLMQSELVAKKCVEFLEALFKTQGSKAVHSLVNQGAEVVGQLDDDSLYFFQHWPSHLNAPNFSSLLQSKYGHWCLAAALLLRNETLFEDLVVNHDCSVPNLESSDFFTSPLVYLAAKRGLAQVCKILLSVTKPSNVNCIGNTPRGHLFLSIIQSYAGETMRTPLHAAVISNSVATVRVLLNAGANIEAQDGRGYTPWEYSSGAVRKCLLDWRKTERDPQVQQFFTPFQEMLFKNKYEFNRIPENYEYCETEMLKINKEDGNNGFHHLVMFCKDIKPFLDAIGNQTVSKLVSVENNDGLTTLSLAAESGNTETVKLLFSNQADVNGKGNNGWTPLMYATQGGHTEIVNWLLSKKADVNAKGNNGWTPLMYAAQGGHTETVKLLLSKKVDVNAKDNNTNTPLMFAARGGYTETVRLLLFNGADVNVKGRNGWTPLMFAAQSGYTETVQLLLSNGNINAKDTDNSQNTPLIFAAENGHTEIVQLLLSNGADVNAQNYNGKVALMFAAQNGHTETVQLLLSKVKDENAKKYDCNMSLMFAAQNGHNEIVLLLLSNGADVNAKHYYNNNTPLMYAAQSGHTKTVQLLHFSGADINARDLNGWTSLMFAAEGGHTKTVQLLISNGAEVDATSNEDWTPLMYAAENDHTETYELLLYNGADAGKWEEIEYERWNEMKEEEGKWKEAELLRRLEGMNPNPE